MSRSIADANITVDHKTLSFARFASACALVILVPELFPFEAVFLPDDEAFLGAATVVSSFLFVSF